MTIYRSEGRVLLLMAAALLASPVVRGQEPVQGGVAAVPASHTVVEGETLWEIAQLYYADPLLWPEIYRLNTAVVEDPHWIYPGEVLTLSQTLAQGGGEPDVVAQREPADTLQAELGDTLLVPEPPPLGDTTETQESMFDRRPNAQQQVERSLSVYLEQPYRPVRRGEFYSAGFLTEEEEMPWATVIRGTDKPSIASLQVRGTTQLFGELALTPAPGASYHVGDSLLVARLDRTLVAWGDVVVPAGIVRVTEVQPHQILGQVVAQFGAPRAGFPYVGMPLEPFRDAGEVRPVPVEQGLEGRVIGVRDEQILVGLQEYVFIDRGRRDGVVPGDVFEAYRPAGDQPGDASAGAIQTLLVVHTRERSATALVVSVTRGDIASGTPVRLTRKMPS
ncbi:MAG TPA: LysM domain-containing protein [Gemmatimonadales bacterium]|jgi:LysM repeat protein|nr:LysM domain-containing protein [Gemmatimonadales bacterium]